MPGWRAKAEVRRTGNRRRSAGDLTSRTTVVLPVSTEPRRRPVPAAVPLRAAQAVAVGGNGRSEEPGVAAAVTGVVAAAAGRRFSDIWTTTIWTATSSTMSSTSATNTTQRQYSFYLPLSPSLSFCIYRPLLLCGIAIRKEPHPAVSGISSVSGETTKGSFMDAP